MPEQPKSGKLCIKQYQKYLDSEARLEIALKIVQTKVKHSLNLLEGLSRFYESIDFSKIQKLIEKEDLFLLNIMKNSEKQNISKSIKQLMTYEGRIAGIYLGNLTAIFHQLYLNVLSYAVVFLYIERILAVRFDIFFIYKHHSCELISYLCVLFSYVENYFYSRHQSVKEYY